MRLSTRKNLVWLLLRRNISIAQLVGYAIANLVGLSIVVASIQFYRDVNSVYETGDSFISRDYLIISKRVSGLGSMFAGASTDFSPAEIADLESQPWVRKIGKFTSSGFNVAMSLEMGGRGISTYMFMESIPDDFFDVKPSGWHFDPATQGEIPIIISKDYLTLYNFGFASSRGLPQLSESMVEMVPLRVSISGQGKQMWLNARIVGFSSRLNTIAVPEDFMQWANDQFADEPVDDPSRLIIEVNSPGNPEINKYLSNHSYEAAGDKVDNGKAAYFLSIVTGVVAVVGVIISLLSFFILLLSIYLLLQKNREKLRDLMMLGYSPASVARNYYLLVGAINLGVLLGAVVAMLIAQSLWQAPLEAIGVSTAAPWMSIAIGFAIMAAITLGNILAISITIRRNFPKL